MKVLHVLSKSTGGIRQHVAALDAELKARGISSEIVGQSGVMEGLAVQAAGFSAPTFKNPLSILNASKLIRKHSFSAQVIHAHGVTVGLVAVLSQSLRRSRVPIVLTLHNIIGPKKSGFKKRISVAFENFVFGHVDKVICPSQFSFEQYNLQAKLKDKFVVLLPVSRPISKERRIEVRQDREKTRIEFGFDPKEKVLCCVARIDSQKNLDVLISAFALANQTVPETRLVIAGSGSDQYISKLKELVLALGLDDKVDFVGYLESPETLIAASDLFVLSSSSETVPFVLLEALSLRVPVVMTNTGIAHEILNGVCGDHSPIGDSKDLSNQIVRWCSYIDANSIDRELLEKTADKWLDPLVCVSPLIEIYASLANS